MTDLNTILHRAAPRKSPSEPQKTAVAPQATAVAPQKTAVAPRAASAAPQKTAVAHQDAAPTPGTAASASSGQVFSSGAEADIEIVERQGRQYVLKLYHNEYHPNTKVNNALRHLGGRGVIADIFETGTTPDGREYELMEYIPGGSLARYDLKGNATAITTIILRVAMALDACHRSGIIHKDIKPANILVRNTSIWECVICDFGISDVMNSDGKAITKQSRTPIYAAPEIYDPARAKAKIDGVDLFEISPAADFYSLGMTALCLWSGEQAFRAAEEQMAIEKLSQGITPPRSMPERLRNIVTGLLQKNPSGRWGLKEIENSLGGHWAVMHTLNPLSDVKLNADPDSRDYAMTGETIGAFLNKVYMWQFNDAKAPADAKICQAVVDSFSDYEGSYMQLFFRSKGDRFANQDSWMEYCCDWNCDDNADKAGPQDEDTRLEISMMKTISGFGFTPYYEFEDDTVTSLEELDEVDDYDRKYGLTHGLRGWLAVQYHEDPDVDLSADYTYEDLLEDYLLKVGEIDPEDGQYCRYLDAADEAEQLRKKVIRTMNRNRRRKAFQNVLGVIFILIPLVFSVIWTFSALNVQPKFLYWVTLILLAIVLIPYLVKVLFKPFHYNVVHKANCVSTDSAVSQMVHGKAPDIGYEELTVEPLYYAFTDESNFDSSINGILNNNIFRNWSEFVKERGKGTVKHFILTLVVIVIASLTLPRPNTVMGTHAQIETTETTEANEQMQ